MNVKPVPEQHVYTDSRTPRAVKPAVPGPSAVPGAGAAPVAGIPADGAGAAVITAVVPGRVVTLTTTPTIPGPGAGGGVLSGGLGVMQTDGNGADWVR